MSVIQCRFNSPWFGNQLFIYAFCRAYAETHGCQLQVMQPWRGQSVFSLDDPPITEDLPRRAEVEFHKWDGEVDIAIEGYAQRQDCLIYTRQDARRFFSIKPLIALQLSTVPTPDVCAHLRHGDYLGVPGFVAIKPESYIACAQKFGIDPDLIHFVRQENSYRVDALTHLGADWMPDFHMLMSAKILFRANSTFSWWAAVLGHSKRLFSPVVDGIPGSDGELRDAPFVEGNHPKINGSHWFCTDLHLKE